VSRRGDDVRVEDITEVLWSIRVSVATVSNLKQKMFEKLKV
jgi:hypothetical protein